MWCSERRTVLSGLLAIAMSGCGFSPLYDDGAPAARLLPDIALGKLETETLEGFVLHENLARRFVGGAGARYLLDVDLIVQTKGIVLTRNNVITRFEVTGIARYRLRDQGGRIVMSDTATAIAAYSAPASDTASAYAARIAGQDAQRRVARTLSDRIVVRVSAQAGKNAL